MAWLSINPSSEPFSRVSAAIALGSNPNDPDDFLKTLKGYSDPVKLAEFYNNADSLGVDLNTVNRVKPCSNYLSQKI